MTILQRFPNTSAKWVMVTFRIPYYTQWGQNLAVCGSDSTMGSWNVKKVLLMSPIQEGNELVWCRTMTLPAGLECEYSYYVVDEERNVLRWEMGKKRALKVPQGLNAGESVELRDLWKTGSDAIFLTSAFKHVIFRNRWDLSVEDQRDEQIANVYGSQFCSCTADSITVHFEICSPDVDGDATLCVIGNTKSLGEWKVKDCLKLKHSGDAIWKGKVVVEKSNLPIKYKYCKCDKENKTSVEIGQHRELIIEKSTITPKQIFLSDGYFREMPWRGAGVAVPMFSLRSEEDIGVGEFLDLKSFVDWAVACGFHLIQLLPVNDTSVHRMWWDSYPYSSLSVFALHPLYLRVEALSENIPEDIKKEIDEAKKKLDGKDVDYEGTMAAKISLANKIFSIEKNNIINSKIFQNYVAENEEWLKPYAAFCFLRDFFDTSDYSQWGRFSTYSPEKLEKITSEKSIHYDIILFHYYLQYHLHLQLSEVAEYARAKGVVLKGDLPIGVDRNSVDTWVYPNLFRMNTSTGAPPDYFDKNGQNWGFPTYNWEEMAKDNYSWWRARLTQMAKYFTAYRIDHILGFFRIWELPDHSLTGLMGKFRPSIALSQDELEREGVWDFDRLTLPFVKQEYLEKIFGSSWPLISIHFLNKKDNGYFQFMEECNTEKKIVSKLKTLTDNSLLLGDVDKIRRNIFDLLKNVVLIRDPEDSKKFYPRFSLEETSSFHELDDQWKNTLRRLYCDYYFHRQNDLWRINALKTLPVLLNSSEMLACGEDLGLIPSCVHPVMEELGLIGLRIQRMPSETDVEFGIPSQYNYMTVCAPSCHDCSTLRAWWEENEERRRKYWEFFMGSDAVPPSECEPDVVRFIIRQHVESPSMWAIFPVQDVLALKGIYASRPASEETVNDPTNPKHYWRFRVHVSVEMLLRDEELQGTVKNFVRGSGRFVHDVRRSSLQPHIDQVSTPPIIS